MVHLDLSRESLIVAGGESGIGRSIVELALAAGARVAVADLAPSSIHPASPNLLYLQCDVTDEEATADLVQRVLRHHGGVNALVTTVGGAHCAGIEETTLTQWDDEIRFNLTSLFLLTRAVLPVMRAQRQGSVVSFSSSFGFLPGPDRPAYAAAKAAVVSLTRSIASATADAGIRVNCIAPGPTDTPRFRAMNGGDEGVGHVRAQVPLGSIPVPQDCAAAALFLVSSLGRAITGQVLHVNGGFYMP